MNKRNWHEAAKAYFITRCLIQTCNIYITICEWFVLMFYKVKKIDIVQEIRNSGTGNFC